MREMVKSFKAYPALSLASAMVWGVVEFVALQRAQVISRASKH
jgi:hypothetical protein